MTSNTPVTEKVHGYPRLAGKIEIRPEFAIFRRFGALNAENLLYLQAELTDLENSLRQQQKVDSESGHPRKSIYSRSWYPLSISAKHGDTTQLDIVLEIRKKLKAYSKFIVYGKV